MLKVPLDKMMMLKLQIREEIDRGDPYKLGVGKKMHEKSIRVAPVYLVMRTLEFI